MFNLTLPCMKRFLAIVAVAMVMTMGTLVAQTNNGGSLSPAPSAPVTIKPKMKLIDVKNVAGFINGVEIRGTEVDAFLDTKKMLSEASESATKAGKKDDESIEVSMRLDQAQNLFTLMQRASMKGAEAEKWKEIVGSIQEAAKAAQK